MMENKKCSKPPTSINSLKKTPWLGGDLGAPPLQAGCFFSNESVKCISQGPWEVSLWKTPAESQKHL